MYLCYVACGIVLLHTFHSPIQCNCVLTTCRDEQKQLLLHQHREPHSHHFPSRMRLRSPTRRGGFRSHGGQHACSTAAPRMQKPSSRRHCTAFIRTISASPQLPGQESIGTLWARRTHDIGARARASGPSRQHNTSTPKSHQLYPHRGTTVTSLCKYPQRSNPHTPLHTRLS